MLYSSYELHVRSTHELIRLENDKRSEQNVYVRVECAVNSALIVLWGRAIFREIKSTDTRTHTREHSWLQVGSEGVTDIRVSWHCSLITGIAHWQSIH